MISAEISSGSAYKINPLLFSEIFSKTLLKFHQNFLLSSPPPLLASLALKLTSRISFQIKPGPVIGPSYRPVIGPSYRPVIGPSNRPVIGPPLPNILSLARDGRNFVMLFHDRNIFSPVTKMHIFLI